MNIDRVDAHLRGGGSWRRGIEKRPGPVPGVVDLVAASRDLLNFVPLRLPPEAELQQLRFILSATGNEVRRGCQKVCDLIVPSGCQTGIKMHFRENFFRMGDALDHAVILELNLWRDLRYQHDGTCKLKPSYGLDSEGDPFFFLHVDPL